MCRTCIALSQCLLILKPQGKIGPSLWLGFPKNSYATSETLQQIFSRAFPWTQMNKMGNQLPSGALCTAAATVSSLAAFKQSMTSYRQGLHLPADCKHHKQDRNKPKNSAAVCKVSKVSSHDPPANMPDCYSDSLQELGCGADLWFANLDFITTTSLLQPQHPVEGEGFAASWVNSSLFTTNHSPLSLSSYWHQTKSTQLLHWSDWEQYWLVDKDLQEKFSSFKPGLYNTLGKGRIARFCPPVISQEPKLLEAQLQLPAARAASSAATKPFPWLPSEFTVVV